MNLHSLDISIVVGYLVFCIVIGLLKYGKIKNIKDYTLGTKSFPTPVLIATTFATAVSAMQVIGPVGKMYELGLLFVLPSFLVPLRWFIIAKIFSPNLERFKELNFLSLSDIIEHLYGKAGRWITNILSVILSIAITAISAKAIGYLLHYFIGIPENVGIFIGIAAVTFYSAFGGIASVAFTDVFQCLIFFIALPVACFIGYKNNGSIQSIINALPDSHTTITKDNVVLCTSLVFYALLPTTGIPFIQRALIAKDKKQFEQSFIAVGILRVPFLLIVSLIGLITYKMNSSINPNAALYYFIDQHLTIGVKGLMIAGMLAIIMSTQDSFLNTTSALISHDICKKIWPSLTDKQQLIIARISCVVISLLSITMVFAKKSFMDMMWLVDNFWDPLVTFPLMAGLLGARISKRVFHILVILSLSTTIITRFFTGAFDTRSLVVGVLTSMLVLYIGNYKYKKDNPHLFPNTKSKTLITRIKEAAKTNDFSIQEMPIISIILAINFITTTAFTSVQSFYFINISSLLISIAFILLLLKDLCNYQMRRYTSILWKYTLIFSLLIVPSYILYATNFNILWVISFLVSALLFYSMTNIVKVLMLLPISLLVAYIIILIFPVNSIILNTIQILPLCSSFLLALAIILKSYSAKYIKKEVISQLEYEVNKRTKELKQALEIKQRFLRNVSHEIRTPLHGILNLSSIVRDDWKKLSDNQKESLIGKVADNGDRLMSLVSNILDASKMSAGKFNIYKDECNFIEIARKVVEEFNTSSQNLKFKLDTNRIDEIICYCDRDRISQVIRNLISNAIKYGNDSDINITIKIKEDNYIELLVIDKGVGVPECDLDRIFGSFEESTRTRTNAGGTGLGLSISKEIIKSHNGNIFAKNNKKIGATFGFNIPIADRKINSIHSKTNNVDRKIILVVDDQKIVLDAAILSLSSMDYRVVTAEGGLAALQSLDQLIPDLILLDIMMPDLGGEKVLRFIRESSKLKNIPVIIQSGYTYDKDLQEIRKLGIQGFITKPYSRDQLKKMVTKVDFIKNPVLIDAT